MNNEKSNTGWYSKLMDSFHALMKKHGIPEDMAYEIEGVMMSAARDQYRAGARSGAAFVREKILGKRNVNADLMGLIA